MIKSIERQAQQQNLPIEPIKAEIQRNDPVSVTGCLVTYDFIHYKKIVEVPELTPKKAKGMYQIQDWSLAPAPFERADEFEPGKWCLDRPPENWETTESTDGWQSLGCKYDAQK